MDSWTPKSLLIGGGLLRLFLICYGRIQDYMLRVKFTDIDYSVYCDAARLMHQGASPYDRATYRYSPLLAYLLLPTVRYPDFGKLLFNACDLFVGWLIYDLVQLRWRDKNIPLLCMSLWLFNPLTAVVSSRGNADVIVCAAVLLTLKLIFENNFALAAVVHGSLAVQLKIYPVIYLPSIFLHLVGLPPAFSWSYLKNLLLNWKGYLFAILSLGSFGLSVWICYLFYGQTYLDEALLYHFSRTDTRHNFSPYFYLLYLAKDNLQLSQLIGLAAFVPQMLLVVYFAFRFRDDLPFCWFVSTFAFVSFNKVCTSQYFVWYLCLLPFLYPQLRHHLTRNWTVYSVVLWLGGQGMWLLSAYLLEFKGFNSFVWIWFSSLVFLVINCWILKLCICCYCCARQQHSKTD